MKICMISSTPLVGAPYRLANALNSCNCEVDLFTVKDYPNHLKGIFPIGKSVGVFKDFVDNLKEFYDLIWIHNFLEIEYITLLRKKYSCPFLLHVHSGAHESPLNSKLLSPNYLDNFNLRFVVAQAWARQYPTFTLIPNITPRVSWNQDLNLSNRSLIYLPSHSKGGRFGGKGAQLTAKLLAGFFKKFSEELLQRNCNLLLPRKPITQSELIKLRSKVHISVDEIITGGFHQVSLEAINSGGCVINGSDVFSDLAFINAIKADEMPPFIKAHSQEEVEQVMYNLFFDDDFLISYIERSRAFADSYLHPERLACLVKDSVEYEL